MISKKKKLLQAAEKILLVIVAGIFVLSSVATGSLAWLMDKTDPLTNTFVYGDINIDLYETDTGLDQDNDMKTNTYKMMPGEAIIKDPKVTVMKSSEDCWLFIRLEKLNDFDEFMEYTILIGENDWKVLDAMNCPGIYYRAVDSEDVKDADKVFSIIQNDKVMVKGSVTKELLNALTEETYPRLKVTAYAVQRNESIDAIDTAIEAWLLIAEQSQESE